MTSRIDQIDDLENRARASGFRVKNFAENCDLCPRQVERRLPEKVGAKPAAWMNRLRLLEAQALLDKSGLIQSVAEAVGFQHARHFNRWFKDQYGSSPKEYRRRNRA